MYTHMKIPAIVVSTHITAQTKMLTAEPTLHKFLDLTRTEESSITFCKENGLLSSVNRLQQRNVNHCTMGTVGCAGECQVYQASRRKSYARIRCNKTSVKKCVVQKML